MLARRCSAVVLDVMATFPSVDVIVAHPGFDVLLLSVVFRLAIRLQSSLLWSCRRCCHGHPRSLRTPFKSEAFSSMSIHSHSQRFMQG